MKKLFLAVLVCIMAAVGIMGCGTQTTGGRPSGHEHPTTEHPK